MPGGCGDTGICANVLEGNRDAVRRACSHKPAVPFAHLLPGSWPGRPGGYSGSGTGADREVCRASIRAACVMALA